MSRPRTRVGGQAPAVGPLAGPFAGVVVGPPAGAVRLELPPGALGADAVPGSAPAEGVAVRVVPAAGVGLLVTVRLAGPAAGASAQRPGCALEVEVWPLAGGRRG